MDKTTLKIKVFLLLAMSLLAMGAVAQNITGHITCDGKGVAGVAVSDGYELTQTDANGYYAIHIRQEKRLRVLYFAFGLRT
jgi:hypothetical protein